MVSPPFTVRDLGEVAIRVRNIDTMFAFYRDVIGLEVLTEPKEGIAFLRIGNGHRGHTKVLALFEPDAGRAMLHPHGDDLPETGAKSSFHHMALNIDWEAQEAAVEWYLQCGLNPVVQRFDWIGWRGVFVRDPDGNTVELVAKDQGWSEGS